MRTFKDLIQEQPSYKPLPNGWYLCALDSVNLKKTPNNLEYIGLMFRIQDGQYQNRVMFLNIFPYTKEGEVNEVAINILAQAISAMMGKPASETDIFDTDKVDELVEKLKPLTGKRLGVFSKLRERISNGKPVADAIPSDFRTEEIYLREFADKSVEDEDLADEDDDEIPF